jgi:hypothetical protein
MPLLAVCVVSEVLDVRVVAVVYWGIHLPPVIRTMILSVDMLAVILEIGFEMLMVWFADQLATVSNRGILLLSIFRFLDSTDLIYKAFRCIEAIIRATSIAE